MHLMWYGEVKGILAQCIWNSIHPMAAAAALYKCQEIIVLSVWHQEIGSLIITTEAIFLNAEIFVANYVIWLQGILCYSYFSSLRVHGAKVGGLSIAH